LTNSTPHKLFLKLFVLFFQHLYLLIGSLHPITCHLEYLFKTILFFLQCYFILALKVNVICLKSDISIDFISYHQFDSLFLNSRNVLVHPISILINVICACSLTYKRPILCFNININNTGFLALLGLVFLIRMIPISNILSKRLQL